MQGNGDENRNIHKTHRGSSNGKKKRSHNPAQRKYDEKASPKEQMGDKKHVQTPHEKKRRKDNQKTNTKTHATNTGAEDHPTGVTRRGRSIARGPKGRHPHSPAEQAGTPAGSIVSKNERASKGWEQVGKRNKTKTRDFGQVSNTA